MHLLQQHNFDIQCSSPEIGKEVQGQLSALLEKEFYPKLEILLNQYSYKNHTWNIDLVELQLPKISRKNWKSELIQKSLQQMENYLREYSPGISTQYNDDIIAANSFVPNKEYATFLFFTFLKTGILQENTIGKDLDKIINEIEITAVFLKQLIAIFEEEPKHIIRWIFSVPDSFKKKIMESITGFPLAFRVFLEEILLSEKEASVEIKQFWKRFHGNKELALQWIELIQWFSHLYRIGNTKERVLKEFEKFSKEFWEISAVELTMFSKSIAVVLKTEKTLENYEMELFFQTFSQSITSNRKDNLPDTVDLETEFPKSEGAVLDEALYINNAGLIILHPFLKTLFEQLELCENDNWKNKMSQHKAILLTQYLITGKKKIQENDLVLNKILCGLSIEEVINTKLKITAEEKEKCRSLLKAVLEYWKTMSSSSVEALQETFLQREGKLETERENTYELWVEEKGYDILLAQLPWGIGMVKTPWMENYLTCHWN
ncbi:contractile injection system tape measure protein [Flavobacterium sp.]|uniref:contractile injection system tape measure protein n=1 Tax=Flavobacterium sp. TaxID=239 RepID=UPI003D6AB227